MTAEQLQELASNAGLEVPHYSTQAQIIRDIQLRRGGDPCFQTEKRYLCTEKCEWSGECRKLKAQWMC